MSDLSARTLLIFWEALWAAGLDGHALEPELPVDLVTLRDRRARVSWEQLVAMIELVERHGHGPAELERIGENIGVVPSSRFIQRLLHPLVSPPQLYRAAFRWIGPLLFPVVAAEQRITDDGLIVLDLVVPPPYRESVGFFHLMRGAGIALPRMIGLPPAVVQLELESPRHATFTVRPPPVGSLMTRLRRAGKALLSPRAFMEELGQQQEEIRDSWLALAQSRRDCQQLIERIPDAVLVHHQGTVVFTNLAMQQALGVTNASELVGRPLLELFHPDDRARVRRLIDGESAGDPPAEVLRMYGDRETARLEFHPPQLIHFGDRPSTLLVARNVTDRWRMSEQLARTDRLSSLGRLAAGVAHELNNPLAYIELNLHLLARANGHIGDEVWKRKARQALDAARHGVERAKTIVRDLGTFSRPELETIELLDVHPVLDSAVRMLEKELGQRARIERDYRATHRVPANRARLEQVFLNLILNAAQSFRAEAPGDNVIWLRTRQDGAARVVVTVEDNGCGISPEQQPRVFDPFFTTKPVGEGTGLGLAICHGIVTRLGGHIELQSEIGRGTAFTIDLPASSKLGAEPAEPAEPAPAQTISAARILVIDDEPALARALKQLIEDLHEVDVAVAGRDGLHLLLAGRYDVVFCDLMMVDFSGMDLYAEVERQRPDLLPRLVFMTGGAFTQHARQFLDRIPNKCLQKPFRIERVLALIEETVASQAPADSAPPARDAAAAAAAAGHEPFSERS